MKKLAVLFLLITNLVILSHADFLIMGYEEDNWFFNEFSQKCIVISEDGYIFGGTGSISVNGGYSYFWILDPDHPIDQLAGNELSVNNPRPIYSFRNDYNDAYKSVKPMVIFTDWTGSERVIMGISSDDPGSYPCILATGTVSDFINDTSVIPTVLEPPVLNESNIEAICAGDINTPTGTVFVATSGSYPDSADPDNYFVEFDVENDTVLTSVHVPSELAGVNRITSLTPGEKQGSTRYIYAGTFFIPKLFRYNPDTGNFQELMDAQFSTNTVGISALFYDETEGMIYGGTSALTTSEGGYFFYYDINQSTYTVYGMIDPAKDVVSISDLIKGEDGCIYGSTIGKYEDFPNMKYGKVFKFDPVTETVEFIEPALDNYHQDQIPYSVTGIVYRPQDRNFYLSDEAFYITGYPYPGTVMKADFIEPGPFQVYSELMVTGQVLVRWGRSNDDGNEYGNVTEYRVLASTVPIKSYNKLYHAFLDQRLDGENLQFSFNSEYENIYITVLAYDDVYNHSGIPEPFNLVQNSYSPPIAFPNPVKPGFGTDEIKFINVPDDVKEFYIYNISGDSVADIKGSFEYETGPDLNDPGIIRNIMVWDLKNKDGEKVASGVYIYYIKDSSGNQYSGKIAILK